MSAIAETLPNYAWVASDRFGWWVACSCGYLVQGWPTQESARADRDDHIARFHAREDDSK